MKMSDTPNTVIYHQDECTPTVIYNKMSDTPNTVIYHQDEWYTPRWVIHLTVIYHQDEWYT